MSPADPTSSAPELSDMLEPLTTVCKPEKVVDVPDFNCSSPPSLFALFAARIKISPACSEREWPEINLTSAPCTSRFPLSSNPLVSTEIIPEADPDGVCSNREPRTPSLAPVRSDIFPPAKLPPPARAFTLEPTVL